MSSSKNSITTVEDRLAEMMIKHMTSHGYKMLNVLRTIGAPTAEGLLGVILKQETLAEETIKQLEENIDSLKEELEDAKEEIENLNEEVNDRVVIEDIADAFGSADGDAFDWEDEIQGTLLENKKLKEENKKLKDQIKQLNIDNELPKTFK